MAETQTTIGCNGCGKGFNVLAETWGLTEEIVSRAKAEHVPCLVYDDFRTMGAPGWECGNSCMPAELRSSRECKFAPEIAGILQMAERLDAIVVKNFE